MLPLGRYLDLKSQYTIYELHVGALNTALIYSTTIANRSFDYNNALLFMKVAASGSFSMRDLPQNSMTTISLDIFRLSMRNWLIVSAAVLMQRKISQDISEKLRNVSLANLQSSSPECGNYGVPHRISLLSKRAVCRGIRAGPARTA